MFKRVMLFILTNMAVLLVLSIVYNVLLASGVLGPWANPGTLAGLLVMAAIFGMGGAFISLLMSKWMARMSTGAQIIETPRNADEAWLKSTVERLARQAGVGTPDVAVYDSPVPNAFATGARRDHAMVAVSTGILQSMSREQLEAVLGHEMTHVANGDMVTLTLLQGVLNTFVIFLARIIGGLVDRAVFRNDREESGIGFFLTTMAAQVVLGIIASLIVSWYSRRREFRADNGGAHLAGTANMIGALEALKLSRGAPMPPQMQAFGINTGEGGGFSRLFASHPSLDQRIAALRVLGA